MFKSQCEYLLRRCDRSDYDELMDELLDLFWRVVEDRIMTDNCAEYLCTSFFERLLEHVIWGWYWPGGRTFSERHMRPPYA